MKNFSIKQVYFGVVLSVLVFAWCIAMGGALAPRMFIGLLFGYCLVRAYYGFAGSVNRTSLTGSTRLMQEVMVMFMITALINAGILYVMGAENFKLNVYPINFGIVIGGILFGLGMAFSSCCGSGVLSDMSDEPGRALITLFFFSIGVFFGFPIQSSSPLVRETLMSLSTTSFRGVFFPDLFGGGLPGYAGALLITIILCVTTILIARRIELRNKANGAFSGHGLEKEQDEAIQNPVEIPKIFSKETYYNAFVRPWSLRAGSIGIAITFALLMIIAKRGWSVTSAYGFWFGKIISLFGVEPAALAEFTGRSESFFSKATLIDSGSIQDFGIVLGGFIALLLAGKLNLNFKVSKKGMLIFSLGGLAMGFGTRLANGCNAGAFYTPISQFSLSGWVFLLFMVAGGIIGNRILKAVKF